MSRCLGRLRRLGRYTVQGKEVQRRGLENVITPRPSIMDDYAYTTGKEIPKEEGGGFSPY